MPMPPPMPPNGTRAMPADGGPPMPPGEAPPDPAQAAQAAAAEVEQQLPEDGRFTVKTIQALADALNDAMPKILGPHAPEGEVPVPAFDGNTVEGKFPPQLAFIAAVLLDAAAQVNPKYRCDPSKFEDDSYIREVIAKIKLAAKDKAVQKLAQEHPEPDADDMGGPSDDDADNMKRKGPPKGVMEAM